MPFDQLIPIEQLQADTLSATPAGSIVLPNSTNSGLFLRFDSNTARLALQLDAHQEGAFTAVNVDGGQVPEIVMSRWSLRVDPDSGYIGAERTPRPGDAYLIKAAADTIGFVGKLNHATAYVTQGGRLLAAEPNFGAVRFIGFQRWAIGYEVDGKWVNLLPTQDLG